MRQENHDEDGITYSQAMFAKILISSFYFYLFLLRCQFRQRYTSQNITVNATESFQSHASSRARHRMSAV